MEAFTGYTGDFDKKDIELVLSEMKWHLHRNDGVGLNRLSNLERKFCCNYYQS